MMFSNGFGDGFKQPLNKVKKNYPFFINNKNNYAGLD